MAGRIYPTVAEAIETQRLLIDEFGGSHGLRDRALLEAAIFRPQSGYYAGLVEEAAALMESLANNHPFVDGNKRLSFALTDAILRANGYFIDVEFESAYEFIMEGFAKGEFRFEVIRRWLADSVKIL